MQAFAAQTLRLVRRVQAFAGVLIGLSLLFAGSVVWQHVTQGTAHAALTQALLETLRRGQP
jgi:hypothetical protein